MAKPNQPKDIKPKAEAEKKDKGGGKGNSIFVNVLTTTLICGIFLAVNYVMLNNISKNNADSDEGADVEAELKEEITRGMIVDLGEFTMNLSDTAPKSFLKVEVSMEVSMTEKDQEMLAPKDAKGGGHGGHGEAPASADPKDLIDKEMRQFKPALRDAVITVLSGKTSDELSTTTGKELAKEQIAEQADAIFGGEREVIRVSFGQFVMQQGR